MTGGTITIQSARSAPMQALRLGATAGLTALLVYVLVFVAYAIVRTSIQIIGALDLADRMLSALIANAFSIGIAAISVGWLLSLVIAPLGALTMLLAYAATGALHALSNPTRAAIIGGVTTMAVMLALTVLVWNALGSLQTAFWPSGYLFWLGFPSLFFAAAIALASWRWADAATRLAA
jgi:hypothetical protein